MEMNVPEPMDLKASLAFTLAPVSTPAVALHQRFSHDLRSRPQFYPRIDGDIINPSHACKPVVPSVHPLHFSTYENHLKAERVFYDQRYMNRSMMDNEVTSVTRPLSSTKENDFLRSPVFSKSPSPSSLSSSSSSNDEYPSYRRYTTNMYYQTMEEE